MKLIEVVKLRHGGRQHIEMLAAEPRHRDFAFDESGLRQQVAEHDTALPLRNPVCADALEEPMGVPAGNIELGECRQVHEPGALAHRKRLLLNRRPPVRALEGVNLAIDRSIPARPLPAENLAELRAMRFQPLMHARRSQVSPGFMLLAGFQAMVHVVVIVHRHLARILRRRPIAEAARIEFAHVDFGLAVHHPLSQKLAGSAALADADRGPAMHPVVRLAGGGARKIGPIRRMGDRA